MVDLAAEVRMEIAADVARIKAQPSCWSCLSDTGPFRLLGPHLFCGLCANELAADDRDGWREADD